jgi:hypothetical protein
MSNKRKAEFVNGNFGIQSFWGAHGEILPRTKLMPKGTICPEFQIQQPGRVPTTVAHKSLIIWSCIMDHQKTERVTY